MYKLLNTDFKAYSFITIISALLFIPFIGNIPLFDWDEINFAECAREMIVSNDYSHVQLYFHPFWEKPPLFIWLQAISMNIFGINEFAARFPNAICGIVTLLVLFYTGKKINGHHFGLTWVFVYASTMLPHLFFKSGIIDPWFNLFIYLAVYNLIQHTNNPAGQYGFKTSGFAGIFLGLALLTKGPAAFILVGLTVSVFFVLQRFKKITSTKFLITFFIAFLLMGGSWFLIEFLNGNGSVIKEFIDYQIRLFKTEDSDHGGPFIYHFIVLLLGCFPASIFLILAHKKSTTDTPYQIHVKRWMLSLFWVVLILFSMVQTKIVHYSSMCYFPLTYLAAYSLHKFLSGEFQWKKNIHSLTVVITCVLGLVFTLIGLTPFIKPWLLSSNLIADPVAIENLKANVHWFGFEWLIGIIFLILMFIGIYNIKRGGLKYVFTFFIASLFAIYSIILFFIPKVEQYTQRDLIEFYKACATHHFSVESIGYRSYGVLFYGGLEPTFKTDTSFAKYVEVRRKDFESQNRPIETSYGLLRTNWMIDVQTKNPSCFTSKITDEEVIKKHHPFLKELYRKNGFIFYYRVFDEQYKSWDIFYDK